MRENTVAEPLSPEEEALLREATDPQYRRLPMPERELVARLLAARRASDAQVAGLREAVVEYLAADAAMPEFADAQRMPTEEWDRLNRRWAAADVALKAALAETPRPERRDMRRAPENDHDYDDWLRARRAKRAASPKLRN